MSEGLKIYQTVRDILLQNDWRDVGHVRETLDLALVLCGARPAAGVLDDHPVTHQLIDLARQLGFLVAYAKEPPWPQISASGGRVIVAADPEVFVELSAILFHSDPTQPLTSAQHERAGLLLGYPPEAACWFATKLTLPSEDPDVACTCGHEDWSEDERRFALCCHASDPVNSEINRAWSAGLAEAFAAAYGADLIELIPLPPI
jgi:hypothetical protein